MFQWARTQKVHAPRIRTLPHEVPPGNRRPAHGPRPPRPPVPRRHPRLRRRLRRRRRVLRDLGLPDHHHPRERPREGQVLRRPVLRAPGSAHPARDVPRPPHHPAPAVGRAPPVGVRAVHGQPRQRRAVRLQHLLLAGEWFVLQLRRRGATDAPHLEPRGRGAVLHLLPPPADGGVASRSAKGVRRDRGRDPGGAAPVGVRTPRPPLRRSGLRQLAIRAGSHHSSSPLPDRSADAHRHRTHPVARTAVHRLAFRRRNVPGDPVPDHLEVGRIPLEGRTGPHSRRPSQQRPCHPDGTDATDVRHAPPRSDRDIRVAPRQAAARPDPS